MAETGKITHTNPFCKCKPCSCRPMCTCGLDVDKPVSVEGTWDDAKQVLTYVVKLKPRA